MELLNRPQSTSFATRTQAPRFDLANSPAVLAQPGNNDDDANEPEQSTSFTVAGDHLKHLMPIDVKRSNLQAVPICLFQHIGQCGGNLIVNGFCSRHILAIFNGTIQTKYALISRNGASKLVSMTGLVNQEPLVSIDNISTQTTAMFPVFELMKTNPDQKEFTFYSNQQKPLMLEQRWLHKIYSYILSNY